MGTYGNIKPNTTVGPRLEQHHPEFIKTTRACAANCKLCYFINFHAAHTRADQLFDGEKGRANNIRRVNYTKLVKGIKMSYKGTKRTPDQLGHPLTLLGVERMNLYLGPRSIYVVKLAAHENR